MAANQFEDVIDACGGMGRYQALVIAATVLCQLTMGWSMLQMSYAGVTPDYTCLTAVNHSASPRPPVNGSQNVCSVNGSRCSGYQFHGSDVTAVSEWSLVCERSTLKKTITSVQMAGVLVGTLVAGQISDLAGRKKTLYSFVAAHIVLNLIAAFSTSWTMFAALRFLLGICMGAILVVSFVFPLEFLPVKWRPILGIIPSWTVGVAIFALAAFLTQNWSHLHIACAVFSIPSLIGFLFVPESIRWLATKGRLKEANEVFIKMARINKKSLPKNTLAVLEKIMNTEHKMQKASKKYTYLDILSTFKIAKVTMILFFCWFSMSTSFYGISFGVGALFGDLYLNIFLLGFLDIPVQTTTFFLNNYLGRRITTASFFFLCCLSTMGCILVHLFASDDVRGPAITGLSLLAKMLVGAAWSCVQVWGSELYPTVTRNLGYGFSSMGARVASVLSAFIINLESRVFESYTIMASLFLVSTILCFALDETKNKSLQDSLEPADSGDTQEVVTMYENRPLKT